MDSTERPVPDPGAALRTHGDDEAVDFRVLVLESQDGGEIHAVFVVPESHMQVEARRRTMGVVEELATHFGQRVRNLVPTFCPDLFAVMRAIDRLNPKEGE